MVKVKAPENNYAYYCLTILKKGISIMRCSDCQIVYTALDYSKSVVPDQMPGSAMSDLGIQCLLWSFCPNTSDTIQYSKCPKISNTLFYTFLALILFFT